MKNFQANDKTIRHLLDSDFSYNIPKFQRSYAWSKDNAQEMWDDLIGENDLFFGSFVFNVENIDNGFIDIVDGQQRFTTINILLSVLKNKLKEIDEDIQAHEIQRKISFVNDADTKKKDLPRLNVNETINDFFKNTIQDFEWSGIFPKKMTTYEKQIKEIYSFFESKIDEHFEENNIMEKNDIYHEITLKILDKLYKAKLIWIEVSSDEDAYAIFETMNARGADLTVADLLKNYIFSKLNNTENIVEVQDCWDKMVENVSDVSRMTISKYLRYYWLSEQDFVTEKNLYRRIKQSNIDAKILLDKLIISSDWAYLLGVGTKEDWESKLENTKLDSKIISSSLQGIRIFGTTQCFVLFLCLLRNIDKINFNFSYIFKEIENYHFIYSAISKLPGNKVEKLYSSTAKEINKMLDVEMDEKKIVQKTQEILSKLKNRMERPAYDFFEEKFANVSYKDRKLIKYIFDRYNRFLYHKHSTPTNLLNEPDYNIEHLLPKNYKKWNLKKEEVVNCLNLLGNLIVVDKSINGWMQDDFFEDKLEKLKASRLPLIEDFVIQYKELKNGEWNENKIIERHQKICELAYSDIWK